MPSRQDLFQAQTTISPSDNISLQAINADNDQHIGAPFASLWEASVDTSPFRKWSPHAPRNQDSITSRNDNLPGLIEPWRLHPSTGKDSGSKSPVSGLYPQAPSSLDTSALEIGVNTLRQILPDYDESSIRNIKELLTIIDSSTTSNADAEEDLDIRQNAEPQDTIVPLGSIMTVPASILHFDQFLDGREKCFFDGQEHAGYHCLCSFQPGILDPDCNWVTADGLTPKANLIMRKEVQLTADELRYRDSFGNTALHVLAARVTNHDMLIGAVASAPTDILAMRNSAGQTFLHVLGASWFLLEDLCLKDLDDLFSRLTDDVKLIRDIYGRTSFHVIQSRIQTEQPTGPHATSLLGSILPTSRFVCGRDAFGTNPSLAKESRDPAIASRLVLPTVMITNNEDDESQDEFIEEQASTLQHINDAISNPQMEDSLGRNGLHCLANAILSVETLKGGGGSNTDNHGGTESHKRRRLLSSSRMAEDQSLDRLTLRSSLAQRLIDGGVDVNQYNMLGNTVLMAFVENLPENGDQALPGRILTQLLTAGADIDARNRQGETALHVAVRCGRKLAVRTLVQAGANVHVRDGWGRSLLALAGDKIAQAKDLKMYACIEACRAWLSGTGGGAVQNPSIMQEWG